MNSRTMRSVALGEHARRAPRHRRVIRDKQATALLDRPATSRVNVSLTADNRRREHSKAC